MIIDASVDARGYLSTAPHSSTQLSDIANEEGVGGIYTKLKTNIATTSFWSGLYKACGAAAHATAYYLSLVS